MQIETTEAQAMENNNSRSPSKKSQKKKTVQGSQLHQNGVAAIDKLGGFQHYPTNRDHPLKNAYTWMRGKRVDDNVGQYWRIHDKLYDLTSFANTHPGGLYSAVWLLMYILYHYKYYMVIRDDRLTCTVYGKFF